MLMKNDPKKVAAMIVVAKNKYSGMKRANEKAAEGPEKVEDIDEGYVSAVEEFASAMESKDYVAAAKSLKYFIDMCASSEATEDDY